MEYGHTPVLIEEVLSYLNLKAGDVVVDATVGGGGHAEAILEAIGSSGRLIGNDKDDERLQYARDRLARFKAQLALVDEDFTDIRQTLLGLNVDKVQGVIFDLGVSSPQLDQAERGFSYQKDGPLDMRMDRRSSKTAETVVNTYTKDELKFVIKRYGEEPWADRIAQFIVEKRKIKPIKTTFDLVEVIKAAIPAGARRRGPHPARRTFQAVRIEVNDELESLRKGLTEAIEVLSSKGRIVTIAYHSLEDRIIKRLFKEQSLPEQGARLMVLTKKPVRPSAEELVHNPRAKSAKLRAAEKL